MAEESKPEQLDRELNELLQGLRVLLPGVQVLFAFLLTVPFSQRFDTLDTTEKGLFVAALASAALASALLVAPSASHRLLFREREKEWLVLHSNRLAIGGTVFLALAMAVALFLVVEVVFNATLAAVLAVGIGLVFVLVWYAIPLARRAKK